MNAAFRKWLSDSSNDAASFARSYSSLSLCDQGEDSIKKLVKEAFSQGVSGEVIQKHIRTAHGEAALNDHSESWVVSRISELLEKEVEQQQTRVRYYEKEDCAETDARRFMDAHRPPGGDDWPTVFSSVARDFEALKGRVHLVRSRSRRAIILVSENGEVVEQDDLVEVVAHFFADRPIRFRVKHDGKKQLGSTPKLGPYWKCRVCNREYSNKPDVLKHFTSHPWSPRNIADGIELTVFGSGSSHTVHITGAHLKKALHEEGVATNFLFSDLP